MENIANGQSTTWPQDNPAGLPLSSPSERPERRLGHPMLPSSRRHRTTPVSPPPPASKTTRSSEKSLLFAAHSPAANASSLGEAAGNNRRAHKHHVHAEASDAIARPRDLTEEISLIEQHAVACGGCSNVYRGKWIQCRGEVDGELTMSVRVALIWASYADPPPSGCVEGPANVEREEGPSADARGKLLDL